MESKILKSLGIDPAYIFLFLIMLIILMFLLYINVNMKYNRLKSSYNVFMRGQDGKTLEESSVQDSMNSTSFPTLPTKTKRTSAYCIARCEAATRK